MASHRPEWSDTFLAPNAAQVVSQTPISVMIVR
jgi:nucleotide-binding universal stress UspA family protein